MVKPKSFRPWNPEQILLLQTLVFLAISGGPAG